MTRKMLMCEGGRTRSGAVAGGRSRTGCRAVWLVAALVVAAAGSTRAAAQYVYGTPWHDLEGATFHLVAGVPHFQSWVSPLSLETTLREAVESFGTSIKRNSTIAFVEETAEKATMAQKKRLWFL